MRVRLKGLNSITEKLADGSGNPENFAGEAPLAPARSAINWLSLLLAQQSEAGPPTT
jgi:hypothetical protein